MLTQIARARGVDLLELVEPDTRLVRVAATRGGEYAGPCPFCGGTDRFHVVPAEGRWYCRQCTPRGGDAIDYVRRRDHLSFTAAVDRLLGGYVPSAPRPALQVNATPAWREAGWQEAARAEVQQAIWRLEHETAAEQGRTYLVNRGLLPTTWRAWGLGYARVWHPRLKATAPAITLPWQAGGNIQAVQYRFIVPGLAKRDRFCQRRGGERLLFGLDLRAGKPVLVIAEGELNAVSLWQVLHERADVLSCGSQEGLASRRTRRLAQAIAQEYRVVFIWLDDPARAAAAVQAVAPTTGHALWSEGGLDANDRLRDGTLADWLSSRLVA
jgi:hypothetical protein